MATNKELEILVNSLQEQVITLQSNSSNLRDEVEFLKRNYGRLVEDVGDRFKVVHEKLFR